MLQVYYTHKSSFDKIADSLAGVDSKYKVDLCDNIAKVLGENQEHMKGLLDASLKFLKKAVSVKRQLLHQVAGGKSDGTSWKASLDSGESLTSTETQKAMKVLSEAYITAIDKRLPAAKSAFGWSLGEGLT
jgi:hypothetical protein